MSAIRAGRSMLRATSRTCWTKTGKGVRRQPDLDNTERVFVHSTPERLEVLRVGSTEGKHNDE